MSTATFLRLPEEKRNRILDAAWEEFSAVPYAGVSVNKIIRRAGIPRGSFYQYFTDKSDLFAYMMDGIRQRMTQYRTVLRETDGDLFAAALGVYDRFLEKRRQGGDILTDRMMRVMEINPKIDLEAFLPMEPEGICAVYQEINSEGFRRRDEGFLKLVGRLVFGALVGTLLDTLKHPEREEANRAELETALDIIRRGSTEGGQSA